MKGLIIVDNIPVELREKRQWVVWRYEQREKKRTNVPYSARTKRKASSTKAHTWSSFEEAIDGAAAPWVKAMVVRPLDQFSGHRSFHLLVAADSGRSSSYSPC